VLGSPSGGPAICLHGRAAERAKRLGVERMHLSIAHEDRYAMAFVIAEGA
jgi:holo-[acyl-carrier protein] synthase